MYESDSESNWDDDFDVGARINGKPNQASMSHLKVTGVAARPNVEVEDWDEDFDFVESEEAEKPNERPSIVTRPSMRFRASRVLGSTHMRKLVPGSLRRVVTVALNDSEGRILALINLTMQGYPDIKTLRSPPEPPKTEQTQTLDPDSIAKRFEELFEEAEKENNKDEMARLFKEWGIILKNQGSMVQATQQFKEGILIANNNLLKAELSFHLGIATKHLQDILQAIKYLKEALNFIDPLSNKEFFCTNSIRNWCLL